MITHVKKLNRPGPLVFAADCCTRGEVVISPLLPWSYHHRLRPPPKKDNRLFGNGFATAKHSKHDSPDAVFVMQSSIFLLNVRSPVHALAVAHQDNNRTAEKLYNRGTPIQNLKSSGTECSQPPSTVAPGVDRPRNWNTPVSNTPENPSRVSFRSKNPPSPPQPLSAGRCIRHSQTKYNHRQDRRVPIALHDAGLGNIPGRDDLATDPEDLPLFVPALVHVEIDAER
jgi:hypothetical protein